MTHIKRDKLCSKSKDTRWDRISKRHGSTNNSANLKTETVKRFIEIDYIGKHQKNLLNGELQPEMKLDPVFVMDLRHKMFKQIPRKLPLATVAFQKNLDICKSHNTSVEEHYIENQLNQFRQHLQKQSKRNKIPEKKVQSLLIDNREIMESLETSKKHLEHFYTTPMEALEEVNELIKNELEKEMRYIENVEVMERMVNSCGTPLKGRIEEVENEHSNIVHERQNANCKINDELQTQRIVDDNIFKEANEDFGNTDQNSLKEDDIVAIFPEMVLLKENDKNLADVIRQSTPSPLADTDEILKPLRDNIAQNNGLHLRCVRFDEDVSVCQLKREPSPCSNTSDGIDSVISELAEEAWLELQMEEDAKLAAIPEYEKKENVIEAKPKHYRNKCTSVSGCSVHGGLNNETSLVVTGHMTEFARRLHEESNQENSVSVTCTEVDNDDTSANKEQSRIIEQLFQSKAKNGVSLMRKYFLQWVHFTTIEKIEREYTDGHADRVRKINIFLDKIRIEKTRLKKCQKSQMDLGKEDAVEGKGASKKDTTGNIKINKRYQNKIKIQQDIIDLQRLKLERQERIIMELKLSKLSEEAREARLELKNELKSVMRSGDAKSKAKAKCLQMIGNLRDKDDEHLDELQGKAMLMPKFLQSMQERALERSVRHEQARQRRLQQEAEREAQKMAVEEAKRLEDEEAKRLRIEALKEKRRQEKMAKIIKERERQQYLENVQKAQNFHRRLLLRRVGMEVFKRLLQRKRDNLRKCEELRRSIYKKIYFQAWFSLYRILKARRCQKADELYERILKRRYIHFWLFYVEQERSKYNVAIDYHELKLTELTFRRWFCYTKRMLIIEETKTKQALSHHEWHLKWKVLDCWQRLPQILQLERETEERRQRWRMKIWELLPDYTPNRDELNFI